jgi:hypothetical protein
LILIPMTKHKEHKYAANAGVHYSPSYQKRLKWTNWTFWYFWGFEGKGRF